MKQFSSLLKNANTRAVNGVCILIGLYQKNISSQTAPRCRYIPTCSCYAHTAFKKHGFLIGLFLTVIRLLKCNPLFQPKYDPVPDSFNLQKGMKNESAS